MDPEEIAVLPAPQPLCGQVEPGLAFALHVDGLAGGDSLICLDELQLISAAGFAAGSGLYYYFLRQIAIPNHHILLLAC
ncbi:MAG: hypothetical protein PHV03_10970, partial [Desulfitobacteriaceae bacterium]|nr:hypothetical protein [Desulfitobacteriaceae bacterium]